jgi:hypothetical protein
VGRVVRPLPDTPAASLIRAHDRVTWVEPISCAAPPIGMASSRAQRRRPDREVQGRLLRLNIRQI